MILIIINCKKLLLNFVIQERTHLNTIFIQFVTYDFNYLFFIQNTRFHNKEREKKKKDQQDIKTTGY